MLRTTEARVIGLALVGVVALGGAVYAATALATGGASAAPAPAQAAQTVTDPQLRASILDMLKDRMGLTGPDAEQFADQMIARMQNANPDLDVQNMVNRCAQFNNADTNAAGPTNGGWGMMYGDDPANGATTPSTGSPDPGSAAPSSPGPQNGGWGMMNGPRTGSANGGRGMMSGSGGGMMGTSALK
jgi:hypothetical protein